MISYVEVLIEIISTPLSPNPEGLMCILYLKKSYSVKFSINAYFISFPFCGNLFLVAYK